MILYFLHGWGYDRHFWAPLREHLPGFAHLCADEGYSGTPDHPPLPDEPFWAIGHSAGACALLGRVTAPCRGLIGINGFARFTQAADFPAGVAPRILARMRRQLARQPQEVLAQFRQLCGDETPPPPRPDPARLIKGLEHLQAMDNRARLPEWAGRLYSLQGADDPLAPAREGPGHPAASLTLPGGHLLPRTSPQACAAQITALVETGRFAPHPGPSVREDTA